MKNQEQETFSMSHADAFLVAVGLLLVGKVLHLFSFALEETLSSLLGRGGAGSIAFFATLLLLIVFLLLLKLLPSLAAFINEPRNPSYRALSYFLLFMALSYMIVMIIIKAQEPVGSEGGA